MMDIDCIMILYDMYDYTQLYLYKYQYSTYVLLLTMLTLEQPKLESKFLDPVPPVAAKIFEKSSSSNSRSYFDLDFASFPKKTLSPIIMVQWKLAVFERSHFSLNHGAMGGRKSMIQNLLSLHSTCPDIPQLKHR